MYQNYIEDFNLTPDNVIVYLRKSRSDDPVLSVEEVLSRHESILDEWAERNLGARVADGNKFREIVSGETISDRPEIQRVLKIVESPKWKALLVVEVQRLSRGDLEDCGRLIKLLRFTNTLVITPQKIYNLHDEYDRDTFERELKRGNDYLEYSKKIMLRGRVRSCSEGYYIGSVPPYGYEKIFITEGKKKYPTLRIKEDEANAVRMIYDLYVNSDMGSKKIADYLDSMGIKPQNNAHWSAESITRILLNVTYTGKIKWNCRKGVTVVEDGEIRKTRPRAKIGDYLLFAGKHEAIISEELFEAASKKRGKNSRAKKSTKLRNPLAGLLYCRCGRAMTLRTYSAHTSAPRLICDDQTHCNTGSCTFDEMIELVKDVLTKSIEDFEYKIESDAHNSTELQEKLIADLQKRLKSIEAKEIAQWEAQTNPDLAQRMPAEIFKALNAKLLVEKHEVTEALRSAREALPKKVDYKEKLVRLRAALDALEAFGIDAETKNKLLKECVERIEYTRERPERIPSQKKLVYYHEKKKCFHESPLKSGANWTNTPISIDVKLKV